jgi:OmpA-OmpF porin, OOP family
MKSAISLVALVLSLLVSPAIAQVDARGIYIGGAIGQSRVVEWCDDVPSGINCDDKDTAFKIFGGYRFNRHFAIELGYTDLGSVTLTAPGVTGSAESSAFELVGVGSLPLGDRFAVYGKAGFYRGEVSGRVTTSSGTPFSGSDEGTEVTFGLGVSMDFTRNVAGRAEWQRYSDFSGSDIDLISIGLVFRFGQ